MLPLSLPGNEQINFNLKICHIRTKKSTVVGGKSLGFHPGVVDPSVFKWHDFLEHVA